MFDYPDFIGGRVHGSVEYLEPSYRYNLKLKTEIFRGLRGRSDGDTGSGERSIFKVKEAARLVPQLEWPEQAGFLHDDRERGFAISKFLRYPVVCQRVVKGEADSILSYARAIEHAPEVHLIDSAFVHLTESLAPRGALFLHRYARFWRQGWYDIPLRHKWTIIDDEDLQSRARAWHVLMSNLQMYPERTMIRVEGARREARA